MVASTSQCPSLCLPPKARAGWLSLQDFLWTLTHTQKPGLFAKSSAPFFRSFLPPPLPAISIWNSSFHNIDHGSASLSPDWHTSEPDSFVLLLDFDVSYWDVLMSGSGCTLFCFSFTEQMVFLLILHFRIGHPVLEVASLDTAFYHKIYSVYHLHTVFDKGL